MAPKKWLTLEMSVILINPSPFSTYIAQWAAAFADDTTDSSGHVLMTGRAAHLRIAISSPAHFKTAGRRGNRLKGGGFSRLICTGRDKWSAREQGT